MKTGQYIILSPNDILDLHKFRRMVDKLESERVSPFVNMSEINDIISECGI